MAWSTKFNHPIKWGARTLTTLHDARDFILSLPNSKQSLPSWQAATEALLHAAQHGGLWLELARIGMLQALLGPKPIGAASQGAAASDKPPHHFSCAIVRLYVAKYSAPAAEAWARNNGATDLEIETARRCLGSGSGVQTASWTPAPESTAK
jgi:hypothetical protein